MLKTSPKLWGVMVVLASSALVALGCSGSSKSSSGGSQVSNLPVLAPATGTALTPGTVGVAYPSQTFSASNGVSPYSFNVNPSPPFAGMTITQTAADSVTLTGTPTQGSGTSPFTFSVQVVDSANQTYTGTYTVFVSSLTLAPSTLPAAVHNVEYSQALTPSGGTGPYSYSVSSGSLPAGITIDGVAGVVTGIPTSVGSSTFTIQVEDSSSPVKVGQQSYTLSIQ